MCDRLASLFGDVHLQPEHHSKSCEHKFTKRFSCSNTHKEISVLWCWRQSHIRKYASWNRNGSGNDNYGEKKTDAEKRNYKTSLANSFIPLELNTLIYTLVCCRKTIFLFQAFSSLPLTFCDTTRQQTIVFGERV